MKTLISLRWFVLVLLLAGPWPTAFAVEGLCAATPDGFRPITREAGRPKFNIPPDSPLARNEHPRFLLTKADLEVLRQRLADGRLAAEFQAVKRQAEDHWRHFRDDPNFRAWVTGARYRLVIEPTEEDRKCLVSDKGR